MFFDMLFYIAIAVFVITTVIVAVCLGYLAYPRFNGSDTILDILKTHYIVTTALVVAFIVWIISIILGIIAWMNM